MRGLGAADPRSFGRKQGSLNQSQLEKQFAWNRFVLAWRPAA